MSFLPESFQITDWDSLKPYYDQLLQRNFSSFEDFNQWVWDRSALDSLVSEDVAWRYIRMTCDTSNKEFQDRFNYFVSEIEPQIAPYANELNKKYIDSAFKDQLTTKGFSLVTRSLEKDIKLFREENIPLFTQIQTKQNTYGSTVGAMTIEMEGQEITLPKASDYLQRTDRAIREEAYLKIQKRRVQDKPALDELYTELVQLRHQVAQNADFPNFRDYMFVSLGRYDYSVSDCKDFHTAVQHAVVPLLETFAQERKQSMSLESLRPWDLAVDKNALPPLKPFADGAELLEKTITVFDRMDPFLGQCLKEMKAKGHLDLESKKGKAPGGYNYPLYISGYPFIFMNATSSFRDMITLLHEGGHAVHSILTKDLEVMDFKNLSSEVAELASMSMELITMDHWDVFFPNPQDLKRAKLQHLESVMETLPWVALIDKFQHHIYENPTLSVADRTKLWAELYASFSTKALDWTGLEEYRNNMWQKQLHLFEVPFYYIEYGIAQLGAIGVWRNYKENPKKALKQYLDALALGNTVSIPEVYATAGVPFDFSLEHIQRLMDFVKSEISQIDKN